MSITQKNFVESAEKIALANLVEPYTDDNGKERYRYIATRIYDPERDRVYEKGLKFRRGMTLTTNEAEREYALWSELPLIDTRTKRLIGKNKERYCTMVSARVYSLGDADKTDAYGYTLTFCPTLGCVNIRLRILGYTFMDVNGDKKYMTVEQIRESDILEHTHSVTKVAVAGMYMREVNGKADAVTKQRLGMDLDDTDTTLDDEEARESSLFKELVGSWYTKSSDGALIVDKRVLQEARLDEIEIPEGITSIPEDAFAQMWGAPRPIRSIKLPETLRSIGSCAFHGLTKLETINMPKSLRYIEGGAFGNCLSINELDLSQVAMFKLTYRIPVKRLILPDALEEAILSRIHAEVIEFRNVSNAKRRVLRAAQEARLGMYRAVVANKIETNGPVSLGDYRVAVTCTDASALEPNIVGIEKNSTFYKVDAQENLRPWVLSARTEYIYSAENPYRFTEDAYEQGNLRAAMCDSKHTAVRLPDSVELLQGTAARGMEDLEYPKVEFASRNLFYTFLTAREQDEILLSRTKPYNMPALQWVLPKGSCKTLKQVYTRKKLLSADPTVYVEMQERFAEQGIDVQSNEGKAILVSRLLCGHTDCKFNSCVHYLLKKYGMIYIGDYSKALRGK